MNMFAPNKTRCRSNISHCDTAPFRPECHLSHSLLYRPNIEVYVSEILDTVVGPIVVLFLSPSVFENFNFPLNPLNFPLSNSYHFKKFIQNCTIKLYPLYLNKIKNKFQVYNEMIPYLYIIQNDHSKSH